ncbi:hypothetical protein CH330_10015 [candidate division WOR-3 bacterium JGI_Cruoil_03_51_56]|uniref:B12-dependent ribonucleotide reductase insertion domain-containing protein n=1 Tax=candidate division WOR-3 bacterium JGI_Cruoil_03_51_56 TaxID=1973747 RepID=A0A235BNR6_UNCW3|nr:MAG: hypothetical protein CH330_10015 [candidate division WOR-3 bacterium JGI_Cruoil_03_51_56]
MVPQKVWGKIRDGMDHFNVMPSMRIAATAGPAAQRDNVCCYNCAYEPVDGLQSFSELMFILMSGTGVGFSVEKENVEKLPAVMNPTGKVRDDYVIEDSREGWAKAFLFGLETWFAGETVVFDYSHIRPYGSPLKAMGGRASGPEPLKRLFDETEKLIRRAAGRKLTPLECHDICCRVATNVISGGKRRSAMISFSDLDDDEMRHAKDYPVPVYRYMSNNSAVYKKKPNSADFMKEWAALATSGTGERGILNVSDLKSVCPMREFKGNERTNPCGEIILRPYEFCNLSEVVVRPKDDISDLVEKVKTAVWIGVIQSTFTHFPFLRDKWRKNCEEERLIGVSLTGQMDNHDILTPEVFKQLRKVAERTAKQAAKRLGINMPRAYTCTKPSGTVSQVVNSASGCHPRWSRYYIRRYRIAKSDPLFLMLRDQGLPFKPEVRQTRDNFTTAVFEFPVKSPRKSVLRNEWNAIKQLDWYRRVQKNWSTHNVSITIYVKDDEWLKVGSYVYEHWDEIVGISFFNYNGGKYELAPYQEITKEQYNKMVARFPTLDFTQLWKYEKITGDTTRASQEFACAGSSCDIR